MNLRPHALQTKQPVVIVDGAPRRKLVRQHTPGTAGTVQIENAIDNFLHAHLSRATAGLGWGNQGFYELPLLIRQIAWIWRPFHIILYRQKTALQPLFTHALRLRVRLGWLGGLAMMLRMLVYSVKETPFGRGKFFDAC